MPGAAGNEWVLPLATLQYEGLGRSLSLGRSDVLPRVPAVVAGEMQIVIPPPRRPPAPCSAVAASGAE